MKHLIYILLIALILTSSSNYKDNSLINSVEDTKLDNKELKKHFMPYFTGVWTLSEYVDDLNQTKSPFKSYDKLNAISEIVFSQTTETDTLFVASGLNNHEGFSFNIIFNRGLSENSLKTDIADYIYENTGGFCDIEIEVTSSDTILNLLSYNADNSLNKKIAFKKIRDNQPKNDLAYGISYFVNTNLIAGKYSLLDTNQTVRNIEFLAEGHLIGFENYKNFLIMTDFGSLVENNLDNISLYKTDRDLDVFLYKFSGDTVMFYKPIYMDEEMIEYGYGDIVYKLIRQK